MLQQSYSFFHTSRKTFKCHGLHGSTSDALTRRSGLVHLQLVVDKEALGRDLLWVLRVSPVSIIPLILHTQIYWTVHHLDSWIKRDQLDITCFIISIFNAQHVSDVNTSILRSLRLICWVISWVVLLWFDVCWCYVVVWPWWCGIRMQAYDTHLATAPQHIPTQHDMLPLYLVCKYELNCEDRNITLAWNKAPWYWSDKIETCRSVLKCFMWNCCVFVGWWIEVTLLKFTVLQ